ncbi:MAG: ParB N-terminal domain-containing protein [Clostridia bacterium]|nr:ParB N-terminal domain-containing protein [Clostridia bacterium]
MIGNNAELKAFLAEEVKKYKGISVPVKAGIIKRALIRWAPLNKLHPNPDDEFCMPEIGPNFSIISEYIKQFRMMRLHTREYCEEPLTVEKIRPDGYMILNGHHRWAAAMLIGYSQIPVRIVDLTQDLDIKTILNQTKHDKRVALDLDEVVFRKENEGPVEKLLSFPANKIYKERLRLGVPALFRYLNQKGYDIWVYTAEYYSIDYIRRLFRKYHVHVCGVVTGTGRKTSEKGRAIKKELETMIANTYVHTIHIDNNMVLSIYGKTKESQEYDIAGTPEEWSRSVLEIMEKIDQNE